MGKILPLIFLIVGGAIGGGAGIFLKPEAEVICEDDDSDACGDDKEMAEEQPEEMEEESDDVSYVALKNQFVVPVIRNELVASMVVMSLSLETKNDQTEQIFSKEPKLRDAFLRVLFDHAHIGGFDGAFTESGRLSILRQALLEAAQATLGSAISDVLITDIARQEM